MLRWILGDLRGVGMDDCVGFRGFRAHTVYSVAPPSSEGDVVRPVRARCSVLLAVVAVILVVGGCATGEPSGPFPERPQDIDVDRLDPCALLTPELQTRLGVEPGMPSEATVDGALSRNCRWNNFDNRTGYAIQLIYYDASRAIGNGTVDQIAGYGVVRLLAASRIPLCGVVVDAEPDRLVRVQVSQFGGSRSPEQQAADVCQEATEVTLEVIREARSFGS